MFVPEKKIGYALSHAIGAPFHCADLDTSDRQFLLEGFNNGSFPVLIATETLAQSVNTACTLPIVFGTKCGPYYKTPELIEQEFGRTDRHKMNGRAVIIADRIELYHLKADNHEPPKMPVDQIVLTYLCLQPRSEKDLAGKLEKTFAARSIDEQKALSEVSKYVTKLKKLGFIEDTGRNLCLTDEGSLLARYCLSPDDYALFKTMAERLSGVNIDIRDKGCLLLAICLKTDYRIRTKRSKESSLQNVIAQMESLDPDNTDSKLSDDFDFRKIRRATIFRQIIAEPAHAPSNLFFALNDAGRWQSLLKEANTLKLFPNIEVYSPFAKALDALAVIARAAKLKAERSSDAADRKTKVRKPVQSSSGEPKQGEIFTTS